MNLELELAAMRWLWLDKNCHYVLRERSPRPIMGLPDVLGVTAARYLTEIEIKRSVGDFRADSDKPCRRRRNDFIKRMPKFFYYLIPPGLVEKLRPEVPEWAGLLTLNENGGVSVLIDAPANPDSERLSLREAVKLARAITNYCMSVEQMNYNLRTIK